MSLQEFTQAVFEAMAFTDFGGDSEIPEHAEISEETRLDLEADCRSWWRRFGPYVDATDMSAAQAGHDFWLTRNGHGAGFWDGDWNHTPHAEIFTAGSRAYGEFQVYLGDDGLVYA